MTLSPEEIRERMSAITTAIHDIDTKPGGVSDEDRARTASLMWEWTELYRKIRNAE